MPMHTKSRSSHTIVAGDGGGVGDGGGNDPQTSHITGHIVCTLSALHSSLNMVNPQRIGSLTPSQEPGAYGVGAGVGAEVGV